MASSFREVLWLDTDMTLLHQPEQLFESPQYQSNRAASLLEGAMSTDTEGPTVKDTLAWIVGGSPPYRQQESLL